ncbi:hypothetical protein [Rhodopirellula sp. MGV]|uniref:hypothetical protein n=1 Tax=Rhodopirellula sp. MGV TaxID=2023130 RepID=UPI000B95D9FE|nr:hypothetical protein [Rhodopirellula sp. MGV]OYP28979.1 hypothetical protein CGZ80_25830 [Rhodopirellula sp. MGV]PNY34966.1 hypothetical protein C2E31_20650 [Rhodopirellula baltica]
MGRHAKLIRLIVLLAIALTGAALTGRLTVHQVNDSPSYLLYPFDSLEQSLLSIRPPVYPVFLRLVTATVGISWVPALQVILHAFASAFLTEELIRRGLSIRQSLLAGIVVLIGCTAADNLSTISTDAPAASLGVFTATWLLRLQRCGGVAAGVACGLFAFTCILMRPAYLFLIPWLPVTGWLVARCDRNRTLPQVSTSRLGKGANRWSGAFVAIGVTFGVLLWMTLRLVVVNDFAVLPFGHQNLSAIAAQLVSTDEMRLIAKDSDPPTAKLLVAVADRLDQSGLVLPQSKRSSLPTLTLENQWGEINYGIIWPEAKRVISSSDGADAGLSRDVAPRIREHRLIGEFNRAILSDAPIAYAKWIALAVRRAVWGTFANLAMHPPFLAVVVGVLFAIVWVAATGRTLVARELPQGWYAFAVVSISYLVFKVGFIVLTSPPIGRFADAAAIFLPALIGSYLLGSVRISERENRG